MKLSAINLFKPTERVNFEKIKYSKAWDVLEPCKSTLENYAKKNNLKIDFKYKNDDQKLLDITITDDNFGGYLKSKKAINADTGAIERVQVNEKLTSDDTFLKRVYRAVSDMKKDIVDTKNKHLLDYITSPAYQIMNRNIENSLMM